MSRSQKVTVVLEKFGLTGDLKVVDVHGGAPAISERHLSDAEWVDHEIQLVGLPQAIWPDEVPADVAAKYDQVTSKIIVTGHMETFGDSDEEYNQAFVVESHRVLP